jgi:hypothetical protein
MSESVVPTKARFMIAAEASNDGKTTILNVKQIRLEGQEETYAFPDEKQMLSTHTVLAATSTIRSARKVLTVRNTFRNPWVRLTPELSEIYLDADGNPSYQGELLEEIGFLPGKSHSSRASSVFNDQMPQVDHSGRDVSEKQNKKPLSSVIKDAVLDKFNGSNRNPLTWLNGLELECERLEIPIDRNCEVLRLFLEGSAAEWYTTYRILLGTSTWEHWRRSFLDAFSCRGWSEVCNAMYYRFLGGSLNEYVIKKLSLLVDMDPKISQNMKVCCIVAGLPPVVREKLDKGEIDTVEKLLAKVNLLDKPLRGNENSRNFQSPNYRRFNTSRRIRTSCSYCEKKGFLGRLHAETDCWLKQADSMSQNTRSKVTNTSKFSRSSNFQQPSERNLRSVNASELEELINNEQKN